MTNTLKLDSENGTIAGVCAGLSNWSGADVSIIRLIFLFGTIAGSDTFFVAYIILMLILDDKADDPKPPTDNEKAN